MPLVLVQNERSAAAITYDDRLGASYEFPKKYQKLVQPGEAFVYYKGKRPAAGGIQVPHYFGTGVVGAISRTDDGRLRCEVEDYQAFSANVPFKNEGRYVEPGANTRPAKEVGLHYRLGVRTIDQTVFDWILTAGGLGKQPTKKIARETAKHKSLPAPGKKPTDKPYDLGLKLAMSEARAQWPSATIFRAPAGQYFSLIIRQLNGEKHHIAVKATEDVEPRLKLSSGEIAYAEEHAAAYSLWVFYALNLETGTGKLIKRKGRITDDDIDLAAAVHGGRLRNVKSGKTVGPSPD